MSITGTSDLISDYPAEIALVKALKRNVPCVLGSKAPSGLVAETYREKYIRASFLLKLLKRSNAECLIQGRGIVVEGAWVGGDLNLEGESVSRSLHFENCVFSGSINLANAILKDLCLKGSQVHELRLEGANCSGNIILSYGFRTFKPVMARALKVSGQLGCSGGQFFGDQIAIVLEAAKIEESFFWRHMERTPNGVVDLTNASVGTLIDDRRSWPKPGLLYIAGFKYSHLGANSNPNYFDRLEWLERQYSPHLDYDFRPQPFEQLYSVLSISGRDDMAIKIAIKKLDYQRRANLLRSNAELPSLLNAKKFATNVVDILIINQKIKEAKRFSIARSLMRVPSYARWIWSCLFGVICGYGYRPERCLFVSLILMLFGSLIFAFNFERGNIVPSTSNVVTSAWNGESESLRSIDVFYNTAPRYPKFNAIAFSADAFIPFVDLEQEKHWSLVSSKRSVFGSSMTLWFYWAFVLSGWLFTAIFAASVSGIVRK